MSEQIRVEFAAESGAEPPAMSIEIFLQMNASDEMIEVFKTAARELQRLAMTTTYGPSHLGYFAQFNVKEGERAEFLHRVLEELPLELEGISRVVIQHFSPLP